MDPNLEQTLYDPTSHYSLWDVAGQSTQVKHRCWVEIDLDQLCKNVEAVRNFCLRIFVMWGL